MAADQRARSMPAMTPTHPAPTRGAHLTPTDAVHRIVGVVAGGTGWSPQEVWGLGAAALASTIATVATRGALRLVDASAHLGTGPRPARRAR